MCSVEGFINCGRLIFEQRSSFKQIFCWRALDYPYGASEIFGSMNVCVKRDVPWKYQNYEKHEDKKN